MSHLIYCHTHRESGLKYVGRTKRTLLVRWGEHLREAREGRGCMPLREAILAHGKDAFDHEVLDRCDRLEDALKAEARWIAELGTTSPERGYNRIGSGRRTVKFADRIAGLVRLPGSRIRPAPKNFRLHGDNQRGAMRGVLADVGIAQACVVWVPDPIAQGDLGAIPTGDHDAFQEWFKKYRGDFQLIDGHLRAEEIRDQGLPCVVLDVDEREAAELLATFDPIGSLAGFDQARYVALAGEFNSTNSSVQQLVADMAAMEGKRKREAQEIASQLEPPRDDAPPQREPQRDDGTEQVEAERGPLPEEADGREYDESVEDEVKTVTCPHCSKVFPAPKC